ncbi:MAG: GTPase [Candidatus Parabeggiatoa sp. nov. 3]|jgi:uncharacterized protein (DUF697 family)|nr:MAG: GTPase [Gammaproteobacteria bacterium]RKZ51479.1 MAG: GTPase [Gammaproteobacteria bacterium]RKZ72682.1 MAG: GTPase [Gammaproteobacteria bacterium]
MTLIETKANDANNIVNRYMLGSVAVGIVPIPIVDVVALSSLQVKMLHRLAKLYGVEFSKNLGKSLIASLLGSGIPFALARTAAKSIPIYGQMTGMISMSLLGGASTYALGKVFIQHFESGGTFLTFDPQKVKAYYAEQLEKGKEKLKGGAGIKP